MSFTKPELRVLNALLAHAQAGGQDELDEMGMSKVTFEELAALQHKVLAAISSRRLTVELTPKELSLLNYGLHTGIGDDGIDAIGLTKREQGMLGDVGNRLLTLAGNNGPRYYGTGEKP